jgi:hypothetical protein
MLAEVGLFQATTVLGVGLVPNVTEAMPGVALVTAPGTVPTGPDHWLAAEAGAAAANAQIAAAMITVFPVVRPARRIPGVLSLVVM